VLTYIHAYNTMSIPVHIGLDQCRCYLPMVYIQPRASKKNFT